MARNGRLIWVLLGVGLLALAADRAGGDEQPTLPAPAVVTDQGGLRWILLRPNRHQTCACTLIMDGLTQQPVPSCSCKGEVLECVPAAEKPDARD